MICEGAARGSVSVEQAENRTQYVKHEHKRKGISKPQAETRRATRQETPEDVEEMRGEASAGRDGGRGGG